ncbi:MAG: hypothetical protein U0984_20095 [Prosthecobacter sp.]|nr:hypothetical protein [Prosthecobacter sp.]
MTQSTPRLWLARDGHVHGPYDLPQLQEMDAHAELFKTDSFCREGEEDWMSYPDWQVSLQAKAKQTVIRQKGSGSSEVSHKTKKFKLAPPPMLASLPPAKKAEPPPERKIADASPAPEARADSHVHTDPQRRLTRMVEALNDHRRGHAHRHPFYFTEPQQLADVITWLDAHHRGWDAPVSTVSEILDQWFIPALAFVKPDTVKPSHRSDFGPGRPWRSLE